MTEGELKPGLFVNARLGSEESTIYIISVDYKEESFDIIDLSSEKLVHLSWFVPEEKLIRAATDPALYRRTMKIALKDQKR
jgi:hypothetical protein